MNRGLRVALTLLLWFSVESARAFTDPQLFEEPAEQGGGGGRQFTGSPEDGYACSSCHRGATAPELDIKGLPSEFRPGQLYEVRLRWDGKSASHSIHLELVSDEGEQPDVTIEPKGVVPAVGRCDNDPDGDAANYSVDIGKRRVVGVKDCGASEVAVQFTAPDRPKLYFAASIVRSDQSGNPKGDGVLDVRRVLTRVGDAPSGGCAVHPQGHSSWLIGLFMLVMARRKTQSRRSSSSTCAP